MSKPGAFSTLALASGLLLALSGCGDDTSEPVTDGPCGPHGSLHSGPGSDPHCHCERGYEERDGTCVEATPVTPREPGMPDCGEHGHFDGQACDCHPGHTQTGLEDERTCEAIPACAGSDDPHEPNDRPEDATPSNGLGDALYACPANDDWYVFLVKAGDRVTVDLSFESNQLDLDLVLFAPNSSEPVAISDGLAGTEQVSFTMAEDGVARVLVTPYGIGQGPYDLSMDIEREMEAPMCAPPGGSCSQPSDCCSSHCHGGHCH